MVEADVASGQHDNVPSQCFDEWEEIDLSSMHKQRYSLNFFAEVGRWDRQPMDVHQIWEDDHLTKFYTGFQTRDLFDAFYCSLGQSVDREDTQYWRRTWPRDKKTWTTSSDAA